MAKKKTATEREIEALEELRANIDPLARDDKGYHVDDYYVLNQRLKELYELREMEQKHKHKLEPPTWDGIMKVGAFVLIGGVIIFKETLVGPLGNTKAFSLLAKIL